MGKISQENNFLYLFTALVSLLFFMAVSKFVDTSWLNNLVEVIVFLVLLLGLHSLKSERSWTWTVYAMMFFLVIVFLSKTLFNNQLLVDITHLSILLIYFIGSFRLSFKQIFMSKKISQNMLIGSVVLYLLLGLIWSTIYLILLMIFPDGFNGLSAVSWKENFSTVTYFSFVTLTTLGFGDISPKNPITQFFIYTEAIVGVFYMATIVSSLVSARLNSLNKEDN